MPKKVNKLPLAAGAMPSQNGRFPIAIRYGRNGSAHPVVCQEPAKLKKLNTTGCIAHVDPLHPHKTPLASMPIILTLPVLPLLPVSTRPGKGN